MPRFSLSPRRLLTICTLLALFFAFLPGKYSGWIDALQGPVDFFFAPISHSAAFISRSFRPAVSESLPSDPDLARLAIERDELQTRVLDDDRRIADLERLVRDLQGGLALAPDASVKAMSASVIGSSSDLSDGLLTVRAGKEQGVTERDTIAVVNGVHLVGRVESAAGRTSRVRPVTRSKAGYIQALVYIEGGKSWRCQLRGTDSGSLSGDLVVGAIGIEPGQIVRLQDPDWPEAAQMLVLGRVESIGQKENFPLRSIVTVRPDIQLERVRRVVLRMPAESASSESGARP